MLSSVILIVIYALYLVPLSNCMRKNVCRTLQDYATIQQNPNCYYDPDVGASPSEVAKRHGYSFESYEIITEDGYILNLFRVTRNGSDVNTKRPPIFLQHGIGGDASSWMSTGPKSIAFLFASKGYDVWLSNCRGSKYSSKHLKYTVYDPEFWNFSFHELAIYDVPAMLEFIASKTGQKGEIIYIGHSMGGTMAFVYASLRPEHAQSHLKSMITLAPVVFMDNVRPIIKRLASLRNLIWNVSTSFGIYGIGQNVEFKLDLLHKLCSSTPLIFVCVEVSRMGGGYAIENEKPETFPNGFNNIPFGVSLKSLYHYAQMVETKQRFQFFDYGPEINSKLYSLPIPPEYPLAKIKLPVYIFYGKQDSLINEKDVRYLYDQLETQKTIIGVPNFSHFSFLSGKHLVPFYNDLMDRLK